MPIKKEKVHLSKDLLISEIKVLSIPFKVKDLVDLVILLPELKLQNLLMLYKLIKDYLNSPNNNQFLVLNHTETTDVTEDSETLLSVMLLTTVLSQKLNSPMFLEKIEMYLYVKSKKENTLFLHILILQELEIVLKFKKQPKNNLYTPDLSPLTGNYTKVEFLTDVLLKILKKLITELESLDSAL